MTDATRDEYLRWLHSPLLSEDERGQLAVLDEAAIAERFGTPLSFGTAGLRTPAGMGPSWLNRYTAARTARALGRRLLARGDTYASAGVCIGYDARHFSDVMAQTAADALRELSIPVYLFSAPRPTPELAFAVRTLSAAAGICMTASHNPPQYIGLKVYWQGGAQIDDALASEIAQQMACMDALAPLPPRADDLAMLGREMDERFIVSSLACPGACGDIAACPDLPVVYTPFHGVGGAITPAVLRRAGLRQLYCVTEQMEPDGDFPTTPDPNPEVPDGFGPALALAEQTKAALIIANDPDADRTAVWARDAGGHMRPLTGNQAGVLLTDWLLTDPGPQDAIVKTLVSTDLARLVAESRGCRCFDTFTGFKFLASEAERISDCGLRPVLAFEEAIGYMLNPEVRDKDGVSAALAFAAMACRLHLRGLTLHDRLDELSRELGFHAEQTVSVTLPGPDGQAAIRGCMDSLRASPPSAVCGQSVVHFDDFLSGVSHSAGGRQTLLRLRGSNVVRLTLSDGCALVVRPSGTEPKIKLYVLSRGETYQQALHSAQTCAQDALHILGLANYTGIRSVKIL